jgi:Cohesin domain
VVFQAVPNDLDPMLTLADERRWAGASSTGVVRVAVNIDDAHPPGSTGLIEARLALTYDPSVLTVSAADIHLGSVLAAGSGWSAVPTINTITGQIAIILSSTSPITTSLGGSLVTIDFHYKGNAPGSSPIELVASVNPTGQQPIITELEDAQGTFTISPSL